MTFDTSTPVFQELLGRVLQSGVSVVPFVGAGLSVYGRLEERLPLWRELLGRLVAEGQQLGLIPDDGDPVIDAALAARQYIRATDLILESLGEPTFRRIVERELDDRHLDVPPAVAQLVGVGWSLMVTTNLDRLIARAYLDRYGRPLRTITSLDTHALAAALAGSATGPGPSLAQIHGDLDIYPSWRLTQSHYEQLLADPAYVEALKHLFLRRVFFVGFGLQDGDFDLVLATVANIYPAGVGEFYALVERGRKRDPVIQRLMRENGLRPIYYDVDPSPSPDDPFAGHREVFDCLAYLASAWAAATNKLEITLKYFPELDPSVVGRDRQLALLSSLLEGPDGGVVQVIALGGAGKTSAVQRFLDLRAASLAASGYHQIFGFSFARADIGQFIEDMTLATVGPCRQPLPECVDRVCDYAESHRVLLVLDGVEAILDDRSRLASPTVARIVASVLAGGGACLATSRIPIRGSSFDGAPTIDVAPLSTEEILQFLDGWGLSAIGPAAQSRLVAVTAGHPLALRILAGVLLRVPPREALATIEASSTIDIGDEVDPLNENRLARVIGSYLHHLGAAELALLTASTVFDGPVGFSFYDAVLTRAYPDTNVNLPLVGQDLRPVIIELVERRLLTVGTGGELSSHPTVRAYFESRAREAGVSLVPLHRAVTALYLASAVEEPETFDEAAPVIAAARHAALSEDWTLFDDLFRRRLMRGFRSHLCNNLGAWDEALALARLADARVLAQPAAPQPAFYSAFVARCLKHLGRSAESRAKYLNALTAAARSRDPETAKHVNNFLTLLVWRGELRAAESLAEPNMRALSWIVEPWERRWQVEHGSSSIAYLAMLQGDLATSAELFDVSRRAWDGYSGDRLWTYDYYPYYRSELRLLDDPRAHDEARRDVESLLRVAAELGWPESMARGEIQLADLELDRAVQAGDAAFLDRAIEHLDAAQNIRSGLGVAAVEIALLLSRLKAEFVRRRLLGAGAMEELCTQLLDRAEGIMARSALELARPEVIAARGWVSLLRGDRPNAASRYREAVQVCQAQSNWLAAHSPRSLVHALGEEMGQIADLPSTTWAHSPVDALGRPLDGSWLSDRLNVLPDNESQHSPEP